MANEKQAEETWVDYTVRRLEDAGVDLTPYVAIDGDENYLNERVHESGIWTLNIGFSGFDLEGTFRRFKGLKKSGLNLESRLGDVLTEAVTISFSEEKEGGSGYFVFKLGIPLVY